MSLSHDAQFSSLLAAEMWSSALTGNKQACSAQVAVYSLCHTEKQTSAWPRSFSQHSSRVLCHFSLKKKKTGAGETPCLCGVWESWSRSTTKAQNSNSKGWNNVRNIPKDKPAVIQHICYPKRRVTLSQHANMVDKHWLQRDLRTFRVNARTHLYSIC